MINNNISNNIKISIIVPIYNVEKYLRDCLNSLERQTLKQIEVIMVNDGSTDNSPSIAKEYSDKNDHFKLINKTNGGLSSARNAGLSEACGEYIYFLDSDDYIADDAMEKLYNIAKQRDLDAIRFSSYCFEDGTNNYTWEHENGYKFLGEYPDIYTGLDYYRKTISNDDYYPSCCLILIKRSIIINNNILFVEGIIHEDNLFYFQVATLCNRITAIGEPLYFRRFRSGSIVMTENWINKNRSMCISAEKADEFIENHPSIKGDVSNWQQMFFINMMFYNWEHMSKIDQKSAESNEYFIRIKPLFKKYGNNSNSIKLFYTSHTLYKLYRWFINRSS